MLRPRIVYLAALAVAAIVFVGTNEPPALAFLALLALLPAACKLAGVAAARGMTVELGLPTSCRVGQPLFLAVGVGRRGPSAPQRIELEVTFRNVMLGEEERVRVVLEGASRGGRFELPLDAAACGRVEVSAAEVLSFDPLGLWRERMACPFSGSYTVYPALVDLSVPFERAPQARFAGSSYDRHRKGQDMSETFDIREYRPSDPLAAIHWKLSSKMDKLMVREASHPSNYDVLVLVDLGRRLPNGERPPADVLAAALGLAASVSYDLCRQSLGHNVAVASEGELVDAMVDSPASFDSALDLLVSVPLPLSFGQAAQLFDAYRRERSFTKTVLVTTMVDHVALGVMGRLTDLSVLLVEAGGAESVEDAEAFRITRIPVDALEERVRSVSI